MAPKKKKRPASDCLITPQHIHESQKAMVLHGPAEMLARTQKVEPEMGDFIAHAAKEIAALAYFDSEMARGVAQTLRERIEALAVSVYTTYYLAVYDLYEDLMEGTPAAKLDPPPAPQPSPAPSAKPPTEEGDADVAAG